MANGLPNSSIATRIHSHSPIHSLTNTNVLVNHFNYLTILLIRFINTNPGVSCCQKMYSQVKRLNQNILGILAKSNFLFSFKIQQSFFKSNWNKFEGFLAKEF